MSSLKSATCVLVSLGAALAACGSDASQPIEPVDPAPRAGSIDIWRDTATIAVGEQITPPFSVFDEAGSPLGVDVLDWSSTDSTVVAVERGVIVAVAPGSAEVIAHADAIEDRISIRVPEVRALRMTPAQDSLLVGERLAFEVEIEADIPFSPQPDRLSWALSSRAVASLLGPGVVQSLRAGDLVVQVSIGGVTAEAPVRVFAMAGEFFDLAATATSTCALREPGIPYCWGGGHLIGLFPDAAFWGSDEPLPLPHDPDGIRFDALEANGGAICGLAEGEIWCWGDNTFDGIFGPGAERRPYPLPHRMATGLRFQSIAMGTDHMCGLDLEGAAWCWGATNDGGQLGDGSLAGHIEPGRVAGDHRFTQISAGGNHTCGITTDSDVLCWGENSEGAVPGGVDPCEWSFNGGPCGLQPTPVAGIPSAERLASGGLFGMDTRNCIIGTDHGLYCWGSSFGAAHRLDERDYADVELGEDHGCALALDGGAYCLGANANGELASTRPGFAALPAPVFGDLRFYQVVPGGNHTCAITEDRVEIYCWGANRRGQLGLGHFETIAIPQEVDIP